MGKITKPVIDLEGQPTEHSWYPVVTKYNYEQAYVSDVIKGLEAKGLQDKIIDWVVPIREDIEIVVTKTGKEKEKKVKEKIYPNYVFVKAIMNEEVWDYLRTRSGASTVLAPGGIPCCISEEEIEKIKELCR